MRKIFKDSNTMYDLRVYDNKNRLHKVIRGEEFSFEAPAEVNAERKPTDHCAMLEESVYPQVATLSPKFIQEALAKGIKSSCTDSIGVFSAIQCYYSEIINEEFDSPLDLDKDKLPLFLGSMCITFENEMKADTLFGKNEIGKVWELALTYINILQRDYNIDFGLTFS
jgi:hypothetical protein